MNLFRIIIPFISSTTNYPKLSEESHEHLRMGAKLFTRDKPEIEPQISPYSDDFELRFTSLRQCILNPPLDIESGLLINKYIFDLLSKINVQPYVAFPIRTKIRRKGQWSDENLYYIYFYKSFNTYIKFAECTFKIVEYDFRVRIQGTGRFKILNEQVVGINSKQNIENIRLPSYRHSLICSELVLDKYLLDFDLWEANVIRPEYYISERFNNILQGEGVNIEGQKLSVRFIE